jgi:hypothetical protein
VRLRAGTIDEPLDRVVVTAAGGDRRGRTDEDGGGEE